jgi:hypothetical protein
VPDAPPHDEAGHERRCPTPSTAATISAANQAVIAIDSASTAAAVNAPNP